MKQAGLIRSSLGKKLIMALTGLFLCSFLIVHLSGNLILFIDDTGLQFNAYAEFMSGNPFIKIMSYGLYAMILLHAVDGIWLAIENKKARPVGYDKQRSEASWASRNMALLGVLILFFLIVHLANFWYYVKFGLLGNDINGNVDIYPVLVEAFSNPIYVIIYLVGLAALAIHLEHGFQSGFQTLGLNHTRYTPIIKIAGYVFGVVIPIAFAAIPVFFFLTK